MLHVDGRVIEVRFLPYVFELHELQGMSRIILVSVHQNEKSFRYELTLEITSRMDV